MILNLFSESRKMFPISKKLTEINREGPLPQNALLVTWDVVGLFTIIPQEEGIEYTREALNKRTNQEVPTEFIVRLLEVILKDSIFQFSEKYYKQNVGTSMGSNPAPPFANNFMAKIDIKIKELVEKMKLSETISLQCLYRFLDDLFSVFIGTSKQLHYLWQQMNEVHPSVKFTMNHTIPDTETQEDNCDCEKSSSVPFLDTSCSIKEGKIILDLYRKPTDRNKYLLPDSCHPYSNIHNIPLSLAIRITRICSEPETRENRYNELKCMLLERKYPLGIIDAAISKARSIPREVAIRRVAREHTQSRRPVFVVSWDPRLPSVSAMTQKHWRKMTSQDQLMKDTFPEPPLVAYKRQKNLGDFLIRAKVNPKNNRKSNRKLRGMKKVWASMSCLPIYQ